MNSTKQPHPAAIRIAQFVKEGRVIREEWHATDAEGRELACLLGAAEPKLTSARQCPAGLMPQWLAYLTPSRQKIHVTGLCSQFKCGRDSVDGLH